MDMCVSAQICREMSVHMSVHMSMYVHASVPAHLDLCAFTGVQEAFEAKMEATGGNQHASKLAR